MGYYYPYFTDEKLVLQVAQGHSAGNWWRQILILLLCSLEMVTKSVMKDRR